MSSPTNSDIMNAIVALTGKVAAVEQIALSTKAQAEKTNGRVTKSEEFINALKAVEHYKKENLHQQPQQINAPNATTVQVMTPNKWYQKDNLVAAVSVVLVAIAGVLSFFAGKGAGQ